MRLRTFITSCLIGRITEPVIRKSTIRVEITTIASAMGRLAARLCWKSTKWAAAPVTSTVEPAGSGRARISLTRFRLLSVMKGLLLIAWITVSPLGNWRGGSTAMTPSSPLSCSLDLGDRLRRAVLDQQADRGVAEGRELGPQDVVDLPRAGARREHLSVHRGELEVPERNPEHDQERGGDDRNGGGTSHDETGEPVPEARLGLGRLPLGAPLQELRRPGVDPVAEQRQDCGQDRQGDRRGEQRHQRSPEPHRVEEALREDDQRRHRRGHGQRGEEDRPSGRVHRPLHRLGARAQVARSPPGTGTPRRGCSRSPVPGRAPWSGSARRSRSSRTRWRFAG